MAPRNSAGTRGGGYAGHTVGRGGEGHVTVALVGDGVVDSNVEADVLAAIGESPAARPAFLYLTGDCVGEVAQYYAQFYGPYKHYNLPIFAVPGNYDGENIRGDISLTAMIQPNVYWTLLTPVVNIVGLYSNVPEGGEIKSPQLEWLTGELRDLPADIPLAVALHHPVYSADNYHSGSAEMKSVIENAATQAGRHPDLIVAGHVHDYQRLTKQRTDGTQIPYLVTGAAGYPNLHSIQKINGQRMITPVTFQDKSGDPVTLESYVDDHHGFLRLDITPDHLTGNYQVPRPHEPYSKGSQLTDYFTYNWHTKKYEPNQLPRPARAITSACPGQPFVATLVIREGGRPAWVPSTETAPGVGSTAWPDA